jgi:transcriptional regulator with XRE-family HTH domain
LLNAGRGRRKNMTNKELNGIRKDRKLSKKEFAALLGITPELLGSYEKGTCPIPESLADMLTATEIEVKKNTRKAARKAKKVLEEAVAGVREAVEDKAAAEEIKVNKAPSLPNIIIQSPLGGSVTPADIAKKVPQDTKDVYVRVDENKLYYVLENGESGNVDIWE